MILTDPEWQAVLLSLKVSSLAVLFSLPFGIFLPGYWYVARFQAKLCSTVYCIYRWCYRPWSSVTYY